jgi:hypothetical protein
MGQFGQVTAAGAELLQQVAQQRQWREDGGGQDGHRSIQVQTICPSTQTGNAADGTATRCGAVRCGPCCIIHAPCAAHAQQHHMVAGLSLQHTIAISHRQLSQRGRGGKHHQDESCEYSSRRALTPKPNSLARCASLNPQFDNPRASSVF